MESIKIYTRNLFRHTHSYTYTYGDYIRENGKQVKLFFSVACGFKRMVGEDGKFLIKPHCSLLGFVKLPTHLDGLNYVHQAYAYLIHCNEMRFANYVYILTK